MIKKISFIYRQYLLGHPVLVLFFLAIILVISATNIKNFTLDASADTLILEDDRDLKIFRNISERYKSSDFMILTLTDKNKNIFSSDTLRLIDTLSREIKTIQNIDSVTSITNIPLVTSSEKPLTELINDIPNILSEGIDRDRAKEEILTSPIYKDLIISSNAKTTAMQLVIKKNESLSNALKQRNLLFEKYKEDKSIEDQYLQAKIKYQNLANKEKQKIKLLIREIRKVQSSYSNDRYEIRLGGIPMITDDMITFIKNDLINFGFGVLLFILITLVIIFRKFIWVAAPIVNCIYAVLFMIGLLGYMDWKVTVISSNFISLMLILTLSMNIHIIVRYRQIFSSGDGDKFYSIHQTTKKMIWPCLYTALTTIVAFASLVFSDIKPVIDFGYMMVIGLTTLFITSFTLLPCFILVFSNKDNSTISNEQTKSYIVDSLSNVALKFGKHIYAIVAVISVITLYGITQLKVENSFINYFRSDTEIHKGMKLIDNQLGGTTPMDIIIKFPDSKDIEDDEEFDELLGDSEESEESNWFTTEKINKIKYVHDYLNNNEYIGKVLSLASSIRVAEIVNDDKELNSLEMSLLYKQLPVEVKDIAVNPYLSIEDNEARINVRILDSNQNLRRADLIEKIKTDLTNDDYLKSEVITITGILLLYNNMLQSFEAYCYKVIVFQLSL